MPKNIHFCSVLLRPICHGVCESESRDIILTKMKINYEKQQNSVYTMFGYFGVVLE